MEYFWVIAFIILAIIFRSRIWSGLILAFFGVIVAQIIFGMGDWTAIVGGGLGFWLGVVSHDAKDDNKYDDEYSMDDKHVNKNTEKTSQPHQSTGIIRCPACQRKLRIKLPPTDKGKCKSCSSIFHITLDRMGYLRTKLIAPQQNRNDHNWQPTTIEDCYKRLNISSNTGPAAVKAAYRKKIFQYHPDLVMKMGEKLRKLANTESSAINAAYAMLKSKGLAH
ncbi:MAG: DnaJ domain-containing protein [Mariprofundales bacterium]